MIEPLPASLPLPPAPRPVARAENARLPHLDGLRALAALFVTAHHAWAQAWPVFTPGHTHDWPRGLWLPLTRVLFYGHFAVGVFIVISGFCLMLPVSQGKAMPGGAIGFLRRRARRILPAYYASLALSLALVGLCIGHKTGTHWDNALPVRMGDIAAHLFLAHDFWHPHLINYPLWSIAVEWHIYLLFPALVWLWRRWGPGWTTAGTMLAVSVFQTLTNGPPLNTILPQYAALFVMGMLASDIAFGPSRACRVLRERVPWTWTFAVLFGGLVGLCAQWGHTQVEAAQNTLDYLAGAAAAALLVALAIYPQSRLRVCLSWGPLAWAGGFSYSLYLIHAPLLQVETQGLIALGLYPQQRAWSFLALEGIGLPLILACAYGFYCLFERPFLSSARRKPDSKTGEASAPPAQLHLK